MRSLHFTIAKNAIANVVRGGASAVVAIALPHFLTHSLGPDRFAGWALMLQIAAYANYLDFGLQTAVARYLAGALEKGDCALRDRLMSAAIGILTAAGVLAVLSLGLIAWQLPHLFHSAPRNLIGEIGAGVIILGLSAAIGLPISAYSGALVGLQRNEYPAICAGSGRLAGAIAVVLVAQHHPSLIGLSLCVAITNLAGALWQYLLVKRLLPDLRVKLIPVDRTMCMELIRYCSTLSVWSFGMLLISGLDVTIVGLFEFQAAGAYSIAATLIMFFTGLIYAVYAAMLAPIAVMQARHEYDRIRRLVLVTTRINSYFSIATVIAAFLFAKWLIRVWVGPAYLTITLPVLEILLIAHAVRLVGNAFGTVLVSMGLQRYGLLPVIFEALLNLGLSIAGMIFIGPTGVAWATLVAAAVALMIIILIIMPRVRDVDLASLTFLRHGVLLPLLAFLPYGMWLLWRLLLGSFMASLRMTDIVALCLISLFVTVLVSRGIIGARRMQI